MATLRLAQTCGFRTIGGHISIDLHDASELHWRPPHPKDDTHHALSPIRYDKMQLAQAARLG